MSSGAILLLPALLALIQVAIPQTGPPAAEYRSAHILLRAPRGADVDAVLRELERGYDGVRKYGLDLPSRVSAVSYRSTSEFVRGSGGSAYQLALARDAVIHLQPTALLLRRADLSRAVRHELVHVSLMAAAAHGLPRWLNEGLAMTVAGEKLPVAGSFKRLDELERALSTSGGYDRMRRAYGTAERMVSSLVAEIGREKVVSLVRLVSGGREFREAFSEIVGTVPEIWGMRALGR